MLYHQDPKIPNEVGICLNAVTLLYKISNIRICLGHQTIGQAFGSNIIKCKEIMHGKVDTIIHYGILFLKT